jgi:hypothetical protein
LILIAAMWLQVAAVPAAPSGQKLPPAVAKLLPQSWILKSSDWAVLPTEFGKTFSGGMRAEFPGLPRSCDITVGPELRASLKGDTAWEEEPMLGMAAQLLDEEIAKARKSLPGSVANFRKSNPGVKSVGALQDETLPGGRVLFVEYAEDCARHPKGTNTVLRGYARRGATQLTIDLWISAGSAEAKAMAGEMFAKFQKLDIAGLLK